MEGLGAYRQSAFKKRAAGKALQDEWKKAVGRIPPDMSNVFVRFKVNSNVNYATCHRVTNACHRKADSKV